MLPRTPSGRSLRRSFFPRPAAAATRREEMSHEAAVSSPVPWCDWIPADSSEERDLGSVTIYTAREKRGRYIWEALDPAAAYSTLHALAPRSCRLDVGT
jgi:hypothetical protein